MTKQILLEGPSDKVAEVLAHSAFRGFKILSVTEVNDESLPRGIRNNNPGNIRINKANNWKGKVPESANTDGSFEQFKDPSFGVRALAILLLNYHKKGLKTVREIISRYAPTTENHTDKYIDFVCKKSGFAPDQEISFTRRNLKTLMRYIIWFENGQDWLTDERFNAGFEKI